MNVLVTGAAGFIGQALCRYLLEHTRCTVTGLDNLNDYYSVKLKKNRIRALNLEDDNSRFVFLVRDIAHTDLIESLHANQYDLIIHLAAQAGVRYSIENPHAYAQSNLLGFTNILELARAQTNTHLVYASSSSVYGANNPVPFSETANTDHPASFYAATLAAPLATSLMTWAVWARMPWTRWWRSRSCRRCSPRSSSFEWTGCAPRPGPTRSGRAGG